MRTVPRENETMYNENLSLELKKAYERSDCGITAIAELMGVKYEIARKYVNLARSIVRSDVERRAVVAINILNKMCDENLLPVTGHSKNSRYKTEEVLKRIDDYMTNLENK